MSFHDNIEVWEKYTKKECCPICIKASAPEDEVLIKEFEMSWLVASPKACLKGTCCLTLKPHAIELYDISDSDLAQFMKEAKIASKALKEITKAKKINYEIHGNTIPHLHMHLFPRYMDDPFPRAPIDYRRTDPPVYKNNEFNEFIRKLREKIENK